MFRFYLCYEFRVIFLVVLILFRLGKSCMWLDIIYFYYSKIYDYINFAFTCLSQKYTQKVCRYCSSIRRSWSENTCTTNYMYFQKRLLQSKQTIVFEQLVIYITSEINFNLFSTVNFLQQPAVVFQIVQQNKISD